jgi:hypothetical protein
MAQVTVLVEDQAEVAAAVAEPLAVVVAQLKVKALLEAVLAVLSTVVVVVVVVLAVRDQRRLAHTAPVVVEHLVEMAVLDYRME